VLPNNLKILYLTYNKLLKVDAKQKIRNFNVLVTNYHGFVYPYLQSAGIRSDIGNSIPTFNNAVKHGRVRIADFDILIVDEYQDIELDFAELLENIKAANPNMQIIFVGDMCQKIYDKTTLQVEEWAKKFMGQRMELEFTQCFRISDNHAAMLGRIWGKTIKGVNTNCKVRLMNAKEVNEFLSLQNPGDVICLGAKTGKMSKTLNELEKNHSHKFNKNTVYATIQERAANINPGPSTAIFTTFDSSKGMEKPICVVFDWDEHYWFLRNKQPNSNYDILRNIFCVAASRGKNEIIFAKADEPLLNEKTLSERLAPEPIKEVHISDMFDFKFTEEIDKCLEFLDIVPVDHGNSCCLIDIPDADGLIDLTPCIAIYQEATYFKNFRIDEALEDAYNKRGFKGDDLSEASVDVKILQLVALTTHQNRYKYQVKLPFVDTHQCNAIHNRLAEQLTPDETVQIACSFNLDGILVQGRCDIIRDNTVWEVKFVNELKREHYLKLAMYLVSLPAQIKGLSKTGRLWNTRDNTLVEVSIKEGKEQAFLNQVARTVRKITKTSTTGSNTTLLFSQQRTAHDRYSKKSRTPKSDMKWGVGELVKHGHFGVGAIVHITELHDDYLLEVRFDNAGTKKLMAGFAGLERV
jgi:hypothetical protein